MLPLRQPCKTTPKIWSLDATMKYWGKGVPLWNLSHGLAIDPVFMFNCSQTLSCPGSNHLPERPPGTHEHEILGLWCIQLVQPLFSGHSKCQNYQNCQLRCVPQWPTSSAFFPVPEIYDSAWPTASSLKMAHWHIEATVRWWWMAANGVKAGLTF